jgi:tetratricopeptide (TPR) repeat protein
MAVSLLAACSPAADSRWTRLRTDNFELYTSASPRSARDTIRTFEQVHGFFEKVLGRGPARPAPVRLVTFGSAKEYEPYKINDFAAAYYSQTADRDYIVMGRSGADVFPLAVHEYVHLLVRHSGMKLPPWLNEGIAELYATLRPMGDKVIVGDLLPGRHRALLDDKWVPLQTILAADHASPYYNEKDKAGSLYNEGWALTHMLNFEAAYRPKFPELMRAIAGGKDSVDALTGLYGKPLDRIERDLQQYLRGTSFKAALFPAKFERKVEDAVSEPLGEFDVALMLSDLTFGPGKEAEREKALRRLAEQDASRPESYRGLGELSWRRGRTEEAIEYFGKAYARGDRDSKLLWDYGRLLERTNGAEAAKVLTELLAKDPERLEVRLELAETQYRLDDAKAALQTLAAVRKVTPEQSARFFKVAVYAHLRNGDRQNAEATARRFREVAKTPEDREAAEALLAQLAPARAPTVDPSDTRPVQNASAEEEKPLLRRIEPAPRSAGEVTHEPLPQRPSVTGRFVELDCRGAQARMVVETEAGRKAFLIEDAGKVAITAGSDGPVDMTCGPQKSPVRVEISFDPPRPNQTGIQGIVRTLAF